jgi:hypothetical protein
MSINASDPSRRVKRVEMLSYVALSVGVPKDLIYEEENRFSINK